MKNILFFCVTFFTPVYALFGSPEQLKCFKEYYQELQQLNNILQLKQLKNPRETEALHNVKVIYAQKFYTQNCDSVKRSLTFCLNALRPKR